MVYLNSSIVLIELQNSNTLKVKYDSARAVAQFQCRITVMNAFAQETGCWNALCFTPDTFCKISFSTKNRQQESHFSGILSLVNWLCPQTTRMVSIRLDSVALHAHLGFRYAASVDMLWYVFVLLVSRCKVSGGMLVLRKFLYQAWWAAVKYFYWKLLSINSLRETRGKEQKTTSMSSF